MNEIMKAIKERRSIRKFKPDMPTKEALEQITEAGLYAASGMGKQTVITIAVTNKEIRAALAAGEKVLTPSMERLSFSSYLRIKTAEPVFTMEASLWEI